MPTAWAVVAACCGALAGCKQPALGAAQQAQEVNGPAIEIASASVAETGHVVVSLRVTNGGIPVATSEEVATLAPTFTLAALSVHPVDGLASWKSLLLTGWQVAPKLPPGGPGTPPDKIVENARQPGYESTGTLTGGDGAFTYVFANELPTGSVETETLRVGVWLAGTPGTPRTTATHDFRPSGEAPAPRDTVLDANCNRCHGSVRAHGGYRVGVKVCLTCHTWQLADPDTVDPAAMSGASAATDPNPLDLGRLVHRIHRGKNLPTLHASSSTEPAPDLASADWLPPPFFPGRNAPVAGRKYAVVGYQSREFVFGRVVERKSGDGTRTKVLAEGVAYPRDLRDCDACHGGAPQEREVLYGVSRRTCQGCHPETWFGADRITGVVHFAHPGGPQQEDSQCRGCHVAATAEQPKVWAPIQEIHVSPARSRRHSAPEVEIVSVTGLSPGAAPTVVFRLRDRVGPIAPRPGAPLPASETGSSASPLPRALSYLAISVSGPTSPDYAAPPMPVLYSASGADPNPLTLDVQDPATGEYRYTFTSKLPATASGTWAVAFEGRRNSYSSTRFDADPVRREFRWPYTGEGLTEALPNAIAYVDTATGTWAPDAAGAAAPRRRVVAPEKCARCHDALALHGGLRRAVEYCLVCHAPSATDWAKRPKGPSGNVDLAATLDGLEERSIHLKVMVHRLHAGGRSGSAGLDLVEPHVIYGYGGSPYVFEGARFPNDLRDCTLCHEGTSYTVEAVPADAPPTVANESPTLLHAGAGQHSAGDPAAPPIQAACMGCHATGATASHAARNTVDGVERCANCHVRGALSVDVVHGLSAPGASAVASTYSAIARDILVPRCASGACHGGSPPAYFPQLDAEVAWEEMVGKPSEQASGVMLVKPYAPEESYLLVKSRGDGASLGGVGTPMPIGDAALTPSELAAIEAWIANGAPND
jgi:OmcA/MtrC family decaheme c-type cytochrome